MPGWAKRLAGLLLFALLLLTVVPGAGAQSGGPVYVVQPGDTLTDIAQRFGTTVEALIETNAIADPALLVPGTPLVIPGLEGMEGVLETHNVAFGEGLHSLSLQYGVPEAALARLNRVTNPERIYLGQPLIVPRAAEGPAALRAATTLLPVVGESLLEVSVRAGLSPWEVLILNQHSDRLWLLPGEPLALPGGDRPASDLPASVLELEVNPVPAIQGRTLVVRLGVSEPMWVEGTLGERPLYFNALGALDFVALQGVHAMAEPGLYDMEMRLYASKGGALLYSYRQPVRVVTGGYLMDPVLIVPPETLDPAATEPEDELVASIVSQVTPERLWEGSFQFPSPYTTAFPSRFGSRRNYNNTGYTRYHSGLDFYGGTGQPIYAPARGRVVLARELTVRGNMTIIDHGWGVFTAYLHQSQILVEQGDLVEPGQVIGLVGGTGRVTGPHLHWEVWVGGVPVDPLEWTARPFP